MAFRDPEKKRAYNVAYREANRQRIAEATRRWRLEHPDKVHEYNERRMAERVARPRPPRVLLDPSVKREREAAASRRRYRQDPAKYRAISRQTSRRWLVRKETEGLPVEYREVAVLHQRLNIELRGGPRQ